MDESKIIIVNRTFIGLLIPSAEPIQIDAGSVVRVVQAKSSSNITINFNGLLVCINDKDFDAIGINTKELGHKNSGSGLLIDDIWNALRNCYDPEISVNIVDLGLIYKCEIETYTENNQQKNRINITMTLTSMFCNMGSVLAQEIENQLLKLNNVDSVNINLVFEPTWTQDMMSIAAKVELGLL